MDNRVITEHVEEEQRAKMKEASTATVTEAKREILWLKGFGIFYVAGAYLLIQLTTDNFPLAIIFATGVFTFIKRFIDTKPENYVKHIVVYALFLPKHWSFRPDNTKRFETVLPLRKQIKPQHI